MYLTVTTHLAERYRDARTIRLPVEILENQERGASLALLKLEEYLGSCRKSRRLLLNLAMGALETPTETLGMQHGGVNALEYLIFCNNKKVISHSMA